MDSKNSFLVGWLMGMILTGVIILASDLPAQPVTDMLDYCQSEDKEFTSYTAYTFQCGEGRYDRELLGEES